MNDSELTVSNFDGSYMKYGVVSSGNKTVFKYTYVAPDEEQIADDEYSEYIYFEIDSDLDSFFIENDALKDTKLILTKSCFCYWPYDSEKDVAPMGIIYGEKISPTKWDITLSVTFYGDETRSFNTVFILK